MYNREKAEQRWHEKMMASDAPEDIEFREELEARISEEHEESTCRDCGSKMNFVGTLPQCPNGCHLK